MDGIAIVAELVTEVPLNAIEWKHIRQSFRFAPQEARIAVLIVDGKRDKQIALAMGLTAPTVRTYLSRMFQRVQVADRVELVVRIFSCARELRTGEQGASKL